MSKRRLMLVASQGGHLEEIEALGDLVASPAERLWVTQRGPRAQALVERGERVIVLPDWARTPRAQASVWRAGLRAGLTNQVDMVVTSGPGMAVPVCLASRLRGARVLFVETLARIGSRSASGRVLGPLAEKVLLQWPDQRAYFADGEVCRPALLDQLGEAQAGCGTFVTVGTHQAGFARLLSAVADAVRSGVLPRPVTVQAGASPFALEGATVYDFLPAAEMDRYMRQSSFVVCHGGVGSITAALRVGRRPMVMPRTKLHGEHFDDHQEDLVDRLASLGLIVKLDRELAAQHIDATRTPLPSPPPNLGRSLLDAAHDAFA